MKTIFFAFLLILVAQMSHADESIEARSHAEAVKFFDHYLSDYNDYIDDSKQTISAATLHFHLPLMQISPKGSPRVVNSRDKLENGLANFFDKLKAQGVVRIGWEKVQVKLLNDNTALASNIVNSFKKDGSIHNRIAAIYTLHKIDDSWKIAVLNQHSPDKSLKLD